MGAAHSAERIQAVRRLAGEGLSDREVAEELGLTKNSIEKIRSRNGIPPGKVLAVAPEVLQVMRAMTSEGATDGEIGSAVGMSKAAVWGVRQRHGIEAGQKPEYHRHGTVSMYGRGCRCEACKLAQSAHSQKKRSAAHGRTRDGLSEIEHGETGYNYWGCRCGTCSDAQAASGSAYRFRSQARTLPLAKNYRKQWTGPELELAAREDLTANEVAVMLGRSFSAVTTMRGRIRNDPKYVNFAGMTKGDDKG